MTPDSAAMGAGAYLPHAGDALLLDAVTQVDEYQTLGTARVRNPNPFCADENGWPSWIAIELMAQVVAAGAGLRELRPGQKPRLGLLLGVREFHCSLPVFQTDAVLRVEATESTRDAHGMGVFDCTLETGGHVVASAILSVYLPEDVDEYLGSLEP